jgi:surface protein
MTIRYINSNAVTNTDSSAKGFTATVPPYIRNPSWPACEAVSGSNKVVGLYAVYSNSDNFITVNAANAYQVDFGDGSSLVTTAGGATSYYQYSYSASSLVGTEAPVTFTTSTNLVTRTAHGYTNGMQVRFFNIVTTTGISIGQVYYVINATNDTFQVASAPNGSVLTLTSNGTGQLLPYRIAVVTITPQTAQTLTSISLAVKHNQSGLVSAYSAGWLDLAVATPNISTFTLTSPSVKNNLIERVRLNQTASSISGSTVFQNLTALKNVYIAPTTTVSNCSSMFSACRSLVEAPYFNMAGNTTMASMFNTCSALQVVPLYDTSSVTSVNSCFLNAAVLQTVPLFNTSSVTNMGSMFNGCSALLNVPLFNTVNVADMSSMFYGCTSLQSVPPMNTSNVTNMTSMFSLCNSLVNVPLFNTVNVTNMSSMFSNCTALLSIPTFNTGLVTNVTTMFSSCATLQSIPAFNLSAVSSAANLTSCFASNPSLTRISVTGIRFTFSVASCQLSASALNEIFTNLPTVVGQTITTTGNYGSSTATTSIATAKGWVVVP